MAAGGIGSVWACGFREAGCLVLRSSCRLRSWDGIARIDRILIQACSNNGNANLISERIVINTAEHNIGIRISEVAARVSMAIRFSDILTAWLPEMLTSTPRAPLTSNSSSSGQLMAEKLPGVPCLDLQLLLDPIMAVPRSLITVRTSSKSALTKPGA